MEEENANLLPDRDVLGLEKSQLPRQEEPIISEPFKEPLDETGHVYEDASNTLRFINYVIDFLGIMVFGVVMFFILGFFGMAEIIANTNENLLGIMLMICYYCLLEGSMGRTLGKLITGTKVINEDGGQPGIGKIFGRTFCRFIPFEAFSYFGDAPGGWHDRMTGTRVVKVK